MTDPDARVIQFSEGMEIITHPADPKQYVIGRDACGPFVGLVDAAGILVHPHLLDIDVGPAAQRAGERLREEQERDRRQGVSYPNRCGPPVA